MVRFTYLIKNKQYVLVWEVQFSTLYVCFNLIFKWTASDISLFIGFSYVAFGSPFIILLQWTKQCDWFWISRGHHFMEVFFNLYSFIKKKSFWKCQKNLNPQQDIFLLPHLICIKSLSVLEYVRPKTLWNRRSMITFQFFIDLDHTGIPFQKCLTVIDWSLSKISLSVHIRIQYTT